MSNPRNNSKSVDVSICNGCYWQSMGNWRASSRLMRLKTMARGGFDFNCDNRYKWKIRVGKELCCKERTDIAVFQETKCKNLVDWWIHALCGNNNCGYIQRDAIGNSGGLLVVWDVGSFIADSATSCDDTKKIEMWNVLENILRSHDSAWVLCGDINEVRNQSDRLNCRFHLSRATHFNDFILRNNLVEIPLNGKRFTRISDDGTKFSKIDRFLVNDNFINLWRDLSVVALEHRESDHCQLLLRDKIIDFEPKPFKIFDEWLNKDGVEKVIKEAWEKLVCGVKKDCLFRDRLKNVKLNLKSWSRIEFGSLDSDISVLKNKACRLELLAESCTISEGDRACWLETRKSWIEKEKIKTGMLKQKARIW
ncbi:uncharacterized protein [Rutidosis leptorrhynchoides]|uniref:uncharacterized protein n=1 Tax=Rutidosis leptorrhynchoides TaxID=125765 RepID=UPI003A98E096